MRIKENKTRYTKVLCKRELTSGKSFWWDNGSLPTKEHPKRHPRENRMLIEGEWYEVVEWKDNSFWIIDSQGNSHSFTVYSDNDKENFPSHCDVFGPRDYSKWFYTPEELLQIESGAYKMSYKEKHDISVYPENYHWVKEGGKWIIAQAVAKHKTHGKHYWKTFGHTGADKTDDDFEDIGHEVDSMKTQENNKKHLEDYSELTDTLFPLIESITNDGTEEAQFHAPIEYHKPLVVEAVANYFDKVYKRISYSPLFK
jgi:hypothetical protein